MLFTGLCLKVGSALFFLTTKKNEEVSILRFATASFVLCFSLAPSAGAVDYNPGVRTTYSTSALSGGNTFQASKTRGTSYGSFQINVGSNSAVKLVRATRSASAGEIADVNPLPSSGTVSYTAATASCMTSDAAPMTSSASACNQYTIPSAPYSTENFTAPAGSTSGQYHQVVSGTCPTFDPLNTSGWTWDVDSTVITYGSGSRPLLNKKICTVRGHDSGGTKLIVSTAPGVTNINSGPGSTCRQLTSVFECSL